MFDHRKYRPITPVNLPNRQWPSRQLSKAPDWCSVDLRDGNQALINPMSVEKKAQLFKLLVELGFKEIEIGFPSASQPDYDFTRKLIDENLIPDDVTVQVLVQAREELISRTFSALQGVKQAVVHVYNSTSTVQREQVFGLDRQGIKDIAITGASLLKTYADRYPDTRWEFQYSPESFTGTELDFAVEVCDAVIDVWAPESGQQVIINLPSTVEMSTPNVFADQIEYFCNTLKKRDLVRISLHTHNDRGCAVAAAELGILAGADRVEGTLMGNGERTGNMDVITMAMNLYSQGVDPKLDISNIKEIIRIVEYCTELPVPARHPWAGELVYTAFSGSHQDAIRKSIAYHKDHQLPHWEVAYLPIDPADIGREYEAVVRINSQSGKGGVALVLERDYGIELPKWLHGPLSQVVQQATESSGQEISPRQIHALYQTHFAHCQSGWALTGYDLHTDKGQVEVCVQTENLTLKGSGQGAIEALTQALGQRVNCPVKVLHFDENALESGSDACARACVALEVDGETCFAVAENTDTTAGSLQAVLSAFSRSPLALERQVA